MSPSTGFLSSSTVRVHFGLGGDTKVAEVEVRWPGGGVTRLVEQAVDRVLLIQE
jgi:hypothetical protein